MLMIIDNDSQFIREFRRDYLDPKKIDYIFFDHNQPINLPSNSKVKGIILSGGKGNPYTPLNLTSNYVALLNFDVPIIGFCLGHEIIGVAYRSKIRKLANSRNKPDEVTIFDSSDPIFEGISDEKVMLVKQHQFHISELSDSFVTLGGSKMVEHEIIKHKDKPIYGFQSHPEVSEGGGVKMVENFLKMCQII